MFGFRKALIVALVALCALPAYAAPAGTEFTLRARTADIPPSNGATKQAITGTGSPAHDFQALVFPDGSTSCATWQKEHPATLGAVTLGLNYYSPSSAGSVRWEWSWSCVGAGDPWTTATFTASAPATDTTLASGVLSQFSTSTSVPGGASCVQGDVIVYKLCRLGADGADGLTQSVYLSSASIKK